jgi:hypothetical protein
MTKDEIIKLARQAGFERLGHDDHDYVCYPDEIVAFATLIAEKEREACAILCESLSLEWKDQPQIAQVELATMMDCALAIRNRGQE